MKYHFILVRMNTIKMTTNTKFWRGCRVKGTFLHCFGGNVNWCCHFGKQYRGSLKKLKIELPYDTAISLLDIFLDKTMVQKDTYTPMFIAALFAIVKT